MNDKTCELMRFSAVLLFTSFMIAWFNEPAYIFCLLVTFIGKRQARPSVTAEFDALHGRLDKLAEVIKASYNKPTEKDKQP